MSSAGTAVLTPWVVEGSYFESCSCEAVCPCRREGDRRGGRSTYGICDFALSWLIGSGHAGGLDLSGLAVVMAGSYDDDEPGSPWRVALYVDERATDAQHGALAEVFLGRAGGSTLRNFARLIGEVSAVRSARIEIEHESGRRRVAVPGFVEIRGDEPVAANGPVSCAIPGHDHLGQEVRTEVLAVDEPPLRWRLHGRCGFATDFRYSSEDS